jgi:hypothetical protein
LLKEFHIRHEVGDGFVALSTGGGPIWGTRFTRFVDILVQDQSLLGFLINMYA